jgi:hypothetical protein
VRLSLTGPWAARGLVHDGCRDASVGPAGLPDTSRDVDTVTAPKGLA